MPFAQKAPLDRRGDWSLRNLFILLLLAALAFCVMGYHPGLEDDAFYLAAVKRNLNPALFPHDAEFFRVQFQATIFDKLIAISIRLTHLPIRWAELLWQFIAVFFVLHGCWRISRRCFERPGAQWSAVVFLATLLSMPLPGIAINLCDQYLHPRTLATALILGAIVAVLDRRVRRAAVLLVIALSIHAIMACFGISFCFILFWNLNESEPQQRAIPIGAASLIPLGWIFEPASDAWRRAAATRSFYFVAHWQWYEWFGVFAPLVLLYAFQWFTQRREAKEPEGDDFLLRPLVLSLLYYGVFQTVIGLAIMLPPSLERLRPFEPMRYLHLLYLLFFLILGGLIGDLILKRRVYRWLLLFAPLCAGMFYAQSQMFPASEHLELPWRTPRNEWLEAFAWIRQNTPTDARFALDPHYMELPDEDYHGFRALAERSVLADYDKDGGMAARVPELAPRWLAEVTATANWRNFGASDFTKLKQEFGVNWIILDRSDMMFAKDAAMGAVTPDTMKIQLQMPYISCPYTNRDVSVCRLY
jgi:hypothetical protein